MQPKLLLLDEPLSNLDAHLRAEMRDLIAELQAETGVTTLIVTHDQEEATVLADTIALMLDGHLRQVGPPADFYQRPADVEVARFFGGQNFIAGDARSDGFHSALGKLDMPPPPNSAQATLTFRPESAVLGSGPNALTGQVIAKTYLGTQTRLMVQVNDQTLTLICPPAKAESLTIGSPLTFHLPPDALWLLPKP